MFELRYYQREAIDSFFEYARNNFGKNPLIVVPTAGGKALISATITKRIYDHPGTRILNITHTKDIIEQNYNELFEYMNNTIIDAGIYSAGLKRQDTHNRIIFAGIQSVHNKAMHLGFFDLIILDEAHLCNHKDEGMYRKFFKKMREINPNIMILGLTATPFRLKGGLLTEGKSSLFDDICYDIPMPELMDANHPKNKDKKQYLCPLITPKKSMKAHVDLSNVHVNAGEYIKSEMTAAFQKDDLVLRAVKETIAYVHSYNRKKCLVFCASIEHAETVYETFKSLNQACGIVHSKRMEMENEVDKRKFHNGEIQYLVNVSVLTTGYNVKDIDCIVMMRSTKSAGLWIQVIGRGIRLHPSKENCLVLDFGKNIEEHGPIDKIRVKPKREGGGFDSAPMKTCPGTGKIECGMLLHATVVTCPECGYEFPQKPKHEEKASEGSIISEFKKPETYEVVNVIYSKHEKTGKPPSLRVDYFIDMYRRFSKWVPLENEKGKSFAEKWLKEVTVDRFETVDKALKYSEYFRRPEKIIVDENGDYPNIIGYIYTDPMPESQKEKKEKEVDEALYNLI